MLCVQPLLLEQLLIARFDLRNCLFIPPSKRLMLVVLDADRTRLNVLMRRAFRILGIIYRYQLVERLVELDALPLIHRLVRSIEGFVVTESRVHLLFDNGTHDCLQLVTHGIQKCVLVLDLLLRERAHGNQLLQEPLVGLS